MPFPSSNDIQQAGPKGLSVANDLLCVRLVIKSNFTNRQIANRVRALHGDLSKKQALKAACERAKAISQAKVSQNLTTSNGRVTITCHALFHQAFMNEASRQYECTFTSLRVTTYFFEGEDKTFHILVD